MTAPSVSRETLMTGWPAKAPSMLRVLVQSYCVSRETPQIEAAWLSFTSRRQKVWPGTRVRGFRGSSVSNEIIEQRWGPRFRVCLPPAEAGRRTSPDMSLHAPGPSAVRLFGCSAVRLFGCSAVRLFGCSAVRLFGCSATLRRPSAQGVPRETSRPSSAPTARRVTHPGRSLPYSEEGLVHTQTAKAPPRTSNDQTVISDRFT
jgi:hypothetical protein